MFNLDDSRTIAGNMAGILAATLSSIINECDELYVQIDQILSKKWTKLFMAEYDRLFQAEEKDTENNFYLTQQISPLVEQLLKRIKNANNPVMKSNVSSKILVKLDQRKIDKMSLGESLPIDERVENNT